MKRRHFLQVSAGSVMAGAAVPQGPSAAAQSATVQPAIPCLMRDYSEEDHRRRLRNIAACTASIRSCMRNHLITDYQPAQCCYNLGEYPSRTPWEPTDEDEQELDRLRDHGIQVIQVFDDWNDSLRLFGGDKFTAVNPDGYRRFIEMAHRRGLKVLTYTSSCFLERAHPAFRQDWSREGDFLIVGYWDMARCSPASPGWRAFAMPRFVRIMDEYGADGIYVDGGYLANQHPAKQAMPPARDEVAAFEETPQRDGAFADFLALVYSEVKRRGGILKLHVNAAEQPQSGGLKVYDYLWVGEGVGRVDPLREAVKKHPPYVVPCLDMSFTTIENEDEPYLHAIPYMQFPILQAGRIFTGERGAIPGVKYNDDFWLQRCRKAWEQFQADPSKLYCHSAWDAVPGNPEARPTHARWLRRYLPLVEEGTWAWLEIGDSSLFAAPLPPNIVASAFANREGYLVLANYGTGPAEISTAEDYLLCDDPSGPPSATWTLPARSLLILKKPQVSA